AGLCLAGRRHHLDGRCRQNAREELWLCADAGAGGADRVHSARRRLRRLGRLRLACRDPGRRATRQQGAGRQMIAAFLPDAHQGGRLHLQHGPIDLIIEAFGGPDEVERAYRQAIDRFGDILPTLVRELPLLRRPVGDVYPLLRGPVARRMAEAVWPHRAVYITPMAAVAGSVADEMLQAMLLGRTLDKAYVNNGGDIAFHLSEGHELRAGIFVDALDGAVRLTHDSPVCGIATSGWGGRSFSLGIADSVTVLSANAAAADAAATIIANAVNADHPTIERQPA